MRQIDLTNKVAIVTASTDGIGLDVALALAENNAKVYLAARNSDKVQSIIQTHKELDLHFVYFDANNEQTYSSFVDEVYSKENRIDILVNNFGSTSPELDKTIFDTDYNDYIKILDKNVKSVFIPSQTVLKYMKDQKSGSIINISSIGAIMPDIARIAYVTSKATIVSLTKNTAIQCAKYNIRCNSVLPGLISTNASEKNLTDEFKEIFIKNTPLNRIGVKEDISNIVLFLASDLSTYITGEAISVAGGFGQPTPLYSYFNK